MDKRQDDIQPLRILILEDNSERLVYFRSLYAGHLVLSADNCCDALRLHADNDFDLIHLDFDLGFETSEAFARHLADHHDSSLIVIHSDNPNGAKILRELLPSSVIVPIARLRQPGAALSRLKRMLVSSPEASEVREVLDQI